MAGRWTTAVVLAGVATLAFAAARPARGQHGPGCPPRIVNHGYLDAPSCRPNDKWGYTETSWTRWPEPPRTDQTAPRAVGAEVLDRPEAEPIAKPPAEPPPTREEILHPGTGPGSGPGAAPSRGEWPRSGDLGPPGVDPLGTGGLGTTGIFEPGGPQAPPSQGPGERSTEPPAKPPASDSQALPPPGDAKPAEPPKSDNGLSDLLQGAARPKAEDRKSDDFELPPPTHPGAASPEAPTGDPLERKNAPSQEGRTAPDSSKGSGSGGWVPRGQGQDFSSVPAVSAVFTGSPGSSAQRMGRTAEVKLVATSGEEPAEASAPRPSGDEHAALSGPILQAPTVERSTASRAELAAGSGLRWPLPSQRPERPAPLREPSAPGAPAISRALHGGRPAALPAALARPAPSAPRGDNGSPPPSAGRRQPMLDGYCPVGLAAHNQWVRGDARWSVVHQDRLYLMSGPRQKEAFAAAPQRYAPAFRGFDPVLAAEGSQPVEGRSEFSAVYRGRLYLFSSAATLARFRGNPKQYAAPESRL